MYIRILLFLSLLLGVSVNGWAAPDECKGKPELRPPTCVELDPPQTIYNVQLTLKSDGTDEFTCSGETGLTKLGVKFTPGECRVELDGNVEYCPTQISVKNSRNAKATFFFTNMCGISPAPDDSVYEATSNVLLEPSAGASFQVTVNDNVLVLIKTKQPGKGDPLTKTVTVGDIIYKTQ